MRLLQFANTLDVSDGGPARNAFELNVSTNRLAGVSNQLFYFKRGSSGSVLDNYDGSAGRLPEPGPLKIGLRTTLEKRTSSIAGLIRLAKTADIAILHGYYLPWNVLVAGALRALKVPFVITPHGALTSHQQSKSRRKKAVFDATLGHLLRKWCDCFVTGSQMEADELSQKFPESAVRVGGVGTTLPQIAQSRRQWGTPVRLLSLSRIAPKKRIDISLRATRNLLDRGYNVKLDIVGSGNKLIEDELRALCDDLDLHRSVTFYGQKDGHEKSAFYLNSDIYLLPSDDENFGISLAEALASGLPAVVSDRVAAATVMNRAAGRVLSCPSPDSVADAISEILSGDRSHYSEGARNCAVSALSWGPVSMNWIRVLSELTGEDLAVFAEGQPN